MIRKIKYTVDKDAGILPAALQAAGVQGEDKATVLEFTLTDELYDSLTSGTGTLFYRFDAITSSGHGIVSPSENLTGKVIELPLTEEYTCDGGTVKITLAITEVSSDFETEQEVYAKACHIRFDSKDNYEIGAIRRSITGLEQSVKDAAKRAETAAESTVGAAERTAAAQRQLEMGDHFIFDGNGLNGNTPITIDNSFDDGSDDNLTTKGAIKGYVKGQIEGSAIAVDANMSDKSPNPVQNMVIKGYVDSKIGDYFLDFVFYPGIYINCDDNRLGIQSDEIGSGNNEYKLYLYHGTSLQKKLPGVWEKIEGKMLIGSSKDFPVGQISGAKEHTLTIDEIPGHNHEGLYFGAEVGALGLNPPSSGTNRGHRLTYSYGVDMREFRAMKTGHTGGSQSFSILNPYISVNWWHRKDVPTIAETEEE